MQDGANGGNLGLVEVALRKVSAEGYPRNVPTEIADGERRNDRFNNCAETRFRHWGLRAAALQPAFACTGIRLIAEDGTVVHARTLEFGIDLHSKIIVVPRGFARTGTTPDGKDGMKWTAKYASVGLDGAGLAVLFDG